jgi:hypothetical protein
MLDREAIQRSEDAESVIYNKHVRTLVGVHRRERWGYMAKIEQEPTSIRDSRKRNEHRVLRCAICES